MPKKKLFYTIFIACEGDNTEPNYLGRIAESIDEERRISVTIFPKPKYILDEGEGSGDNRRSDPVGLVEEACRKLNEGFDEAWAVFDKNGHTGHIEAFQKAEAGANGKKVTIAFSSIAFEHWILLHFEQNRTAFPKSKNLIDDRFLATGAGFFPDYTKNREMDIYPVLEDKTMVAIENAAWLRQQVNGELENADGKVYEVNPYTNVDELAKLLLDIPYNFTWASYGEEISFLGYSIHVLLGDEGFSVNLKNEAGITLILNAGNLSDYFFLHNAGTSLQIAQTLRLNPDAATDFVLTSEEPLPQNVRLVFQVGVERLVIG